MKLVWHRHEGKWHAYRQDGYSLCENSLLSPLLGSSGLIGRIIPTDARDTRGPGAYCTTCKKAAVNMAARKRRVRS